MKSDIFKLLSSDKECCIMRNHATKMYDMKKSEVSFNVVYGGNLPGDVGKFIPAIL